MCVSSVALSLWEGPVDPLSTALPCASAPDILGLAVLLVPSRLSRQHVSVGVFSQSLEVWHKVLSQSSLSKLGTRVPGVLRRDFPGGTVVKNPPANALDTGLSPGPGRSHMLWSN